MSDPEDPQEEFESCDFTVGVIWRDTLCVESVFRTFFRPRGRYDQSDTEEGAHHIQAE